MLLHDCVINVISTKRKSSKINVLLARNASLIPITLCISAKLTRCPGRHIYYMYDNGAIAKRTAQRCFARSGLPSEFDDDYLKTLSMDDCRQTTKKLDKKVGCSSKAIVNYFKSLEFTQKFGAQLTYEYREFNILRGITRRAATVIDSCIEFSLMMRSDVCMNQGSM